MAKLIAIRIDVTKLDESRYYKGAKGTYLDITGILNDDPDKNGNYGFHTQQVTKEEREAKVQMPILGNFKVLKEISKGYNAVPTPQAPAPSSPFPNGLNEPESDDLPF
jgi:hypothetical protein